jgi:small subunit ribosomal protein S7
MSPSFSLFCTKFINILTRDGKKLKASKLFFDTCLQLKKQKAVDAEKNKKRGYTLDGETSLSTLFSQAVENVTPTLEVRKVRIAGSTYLVPTVLSKKKQTSLALKWIIQSAIQRKKNSKHPFSHCLAEELLDASKKAGLARQKRDDLHRLAEANRAYIRYRWW